MDCHDQRQVEREQVARNLQRIFPLEEGAYFEYEGDEATGEARRCFMDGSRMSEDDLYRAHVCPGSQEKMHISPLCQMDTPEGHIWHARWLCLVVPFMEDLAIPDSGGHRLRDGALLLQRYGINLYMAGNPDNSCTVYVLLSDPMPLPETYAPLRAISEVLKVMDDIGVVSREIMDDPDATDLSVPNTRIMPYWSADDGFGDFFLSDLCAGEEVYAYKPYSEINLEYTDPESLLRFADHLERGYLEEELWYVDQDELGGFGPEISSSEPREGGESSFLMRLARGIGRLTRR